MHPFKLKDILDESLQTAKSRIMDWNVTGKRPHEDRSRKWVTALAERFQAIFADEPDVCTYWRQARMTEGLPTNEFLYDILVGRTKTTPSRRKRANYPYVCQPLWLIESEFERDHDRQILLDFNKLVIGACPNRLFIMSQVPTANEYREMLQPVSEACQVTVDVAFVPHPADWVPNDQAIELWRLTNGEWEPMG